MRISFSYRIKTIHVYMCIQYIYIYILLVSETFNFSARQHSPCVELFCALKICVCIYAREYKLRQSEYQLRECKLLNESFVVMRLLIYIYI